jgi:hypothetical protein
VADDSWSVVADNRGVPEQGGDQIGGWVAVGGACGRPRTRVTHPPRWARPERVVSRSDLDAPLSRPARYGWQSPTAADGPLGLEFGDYQHTVQLGILMDQLWGRCRRSRRGGLSTCGVCGSSRDRPLETVLPVRGTDTQAILGTSLTGAAKRPLLNCDASLE